MATLQTVPFLSQPHHVDTNDPAYMELFAQIDQMFQELYQDVSILNADVNVINGTVAGSSAPSTSVTMPQVMLRAVIGI